MATWEEFVCKTKDVACSAGRKASDLAEIAKQKLKIAENENAIKDTMEALGRLLYDSRHNDKELDEELVGELLAQVDELKKANVNLRASIDNLSGRKVCEKCGAVNPQAAFYCNNCGNKMD